MKKSLLIVLVVLIALTFFGCAPKPDKVAKDFLTAMQNNDVTAMKANATDESAKAIEFIGMMQAEKKLVKSFKIVSSSVTGDSATVVYNLVTNSEKDEATEDKQETMKLIKKDGKWKVHIAKDDMQK